MINVGKYESCVCLSRSNPTKLCDGRLSFEENGRKIILRPKSGEEALAIVVDGGVCRDKLPKCDGLFLLRKSNKRWIILVELKGSDLEHAFEQLAYMKKERMEYRELLSLFGGVGAGVLVEKAFVVSNRMISRTAHQKLERENGIRVSGILQSAASSPIPDLRNYL